jgi:hypothetical protein
LATLVSTISVLDRYFVWIFILFGLFVCSSWNRHFLWLQIHKDQIFNVHKGSRRQTQISQQRNQKCCSVWNRGCTSLFFFFSPKIITLWEKRECQMVFFFLQSLKLLLWLLGPRLCATNSIRFDWYVSKCIKWQNQKKTNPIIFWSCWHVSSFWIKEQELMFTLWLMERAVNDNTIEWLHLRYFSFHKIEYENENFVFIVHLLSQTEIIWIVFREWNKAVHLSPRVKQFCLNWWEIPNTTISKKSVHSSNNPEKILILSLTSKSSNNRERHFRFWVLNFECHFWNRSSFVRKWIEFY